MVILVGKWVNSFVKANEKKMNLIIDAKSINPYNNCNLRKIIYHQYLPMFNGISDQLGARFDRLRYEVFQNLILSPMNTCLLRPAVATAPTVYGIETGELWSIGHIYIKLQQHLPFTVCAAECEAAEEQSDDEVHTLQVPERSEGKTKVMRK